MNIIDLKINKLKEIFVNQKWCVLEVEITGAVSAYFILQKPKYRYLEAECSLQFCDILTEKSIIIDIITAKEIEINEDINLYEISLDNGQEIKLKMY